MPEDAFDIWSKMLILVTLFKAQLHDRAAQLTKFMSFHCFDKVTVILHRLRRTKLLPGSHP